MTSRGRRRIAAAFVAAVVIGCSNDYGELQFLDDPDPGSAGAGGTGGLTSIASHGGEAGVGSGGCSSNAECGTIVGFCKRGICECAGDECRLGESCVRDSSGTRCGCNGGPECNPSETCCPAPDGCTDGPCG